MTHDGQRRKIVVMVCESKGERRDSNPDMEPHCADAVYQYLASGALASGSINAAPLSSTTTVTNSPLHTVAAVPVTHDVTRY